jgi:hypothetical protein
LADSSQAYQKGVGQREAQQSDAIVRSIGYKAEDTNPPCAIFPRTGELSLIVPNAGGFAGISFQYAEAKLSLDYRADFFSAQWMQATI